MRRRLQPAALPCSGSNTGVENVSLNCCRSSLICFCIAAILSTLLVMFQPVGRSLKFFFKIGNPSVLKFFRDMLCDGGPDLVPVIVFCKGVSIDCPAVAGED